MQLSNAEIRPNEAQYESDIDGKFGMAHVNYSFCVLDEKKFTRNRNIVRPLVENYWFLYKHSGTHQVKKISITCLFKEIFGYYWIS